MKVARKKFVWITVFVGVASLVASVALISGRTQTVRLPNGTELSFVTMSRGPTNICFPGGVWDRLKYRLLPAKGISIGRLKIAPVAPLLAVAHYVEDGRLAFPNKAVVWIRHRGGTNAPPLPVEEHKTFYDLRATMADEQREEWEMSSMVCASLTSGSPVLGRGRPTYSGRGMCAGTCRMGDIRPGWSKVAMVCESNRHGLRTPLVVLPPASHG